MLLTVVTFSLLSGLAAGWQRHRGLAAGWQRHRESMAYEALRKVVETPGEHYFRAIDAAAERYFRAIDAAAGALEQRQVGHANEELDACEPRFRDVEWHLLKALCRGPVSIPFQPDRDNRDRTYPVGFTPDHQYVALFNGSSCVLHFHDPATGRELHRFGAFPAVISPDGRLLAGRGRWPGASVWEVSTGNLLKIFPDMGNEVGRRFFTFGGVVTALKECLRANPGEEPGWGARTFQEITDSRAQCVSPDGKLTFGQRPDPDQLGNSALGKVGLYDSHNRALRNSRPSRGVNGTKVGLYDSHNGMLLFDFPHEGIRILDFLGFSRDGKRFLTYQGQSVRVWESASFRAVLTVPVIVAPVLFYRDQFLGFQSPPNHVLYDGETLWWFDANGEIKICDLRPR
jgi:hypothetical protein